MYKNDVFIDIISGKLSVNSHNKNTIKNALCVLIYIYISTRCIFMGVNIYQCDYFPRYIKINNNITKYIISNFGSVVIVK